MTEPRTSREALLRFAERDLAAGASSENVVEMLVSNGLDPADARSVVRTTRRTRRLGSIGVGLAWMAGGAVLAVGGAFAAVVSLASWGFLAYPFGLVAVVGLVLLVTGVVRMFR